MAPISVVTECNGTYCNPMIMTKNVRARLLHENFFVRIFWSGGCQLRWGSESENNFCFRPYIVYRYVYQALYAPNDLIPLSISILGCLSVCFVDNEDLYKSQRTSTPTVPSPLPNRTMLHANVTTEKALETLEEAFESFPNEMEYCMDNDGYGPTIFVIAARMCFQLERFDQGAKLLRKALEICLIAKGISDLALIDKMFWLPANLNFKLYSMVWFNFSRSSLELPTFTHFVSSSSLSLLTCYFRLNCGEKTENIHLFFHSIAKHETQNLVSGDRFSLNFPIF